MSDNRQAISQLTTQVNSLQELVDAPAEGSKGSPRRKNPDNAREEPKD